MTKRHESLPTNAKRCDPSSKPQRSFFLFRSLNWNAHSLKLPGPVFQPRHEVSILLLRHRCNRRRTLVSWCTPSPAEAWLHSRVIKNQQRDTPIPCCYHHPSHSPPFFINVDNFKLHKGNAAAPIPRQAAASLRTAPSLSAGCCFQILSLKFDCVQHPQFVGIQE